MELSRTLLMPERPLLFGQAIDSGSVPTFESGFFQINVQLPANVPATVGSLSITVGGVADPPVAIAVRQRQEVLARPFPRTAVKAAAARSKSANVFWQAGD